ncbi:integrator complex subunit 1-like isoform X2 [Dysidea avara]|uniref:integrator complex subunit 1-like isoform X2 n=1 Tax=Dysidea avara TaxID=196820 RepID=UPI00331D943A
MSNRRAQHTAKQRGHAPPANLFALGSKPSGPQKTFVVSSEGELKPSPTPPPPKPSVVLAQSQAAGMPSAKKPKLLSGTPSSIGQPSQSTAGGLFSNPIRLPQQSQSAGNPASRTGKGLPPGPKSAVLPSTSSQIMPMDVKTTELVDMVTKTCEADDDVKAIRLILGALKQLKQSRIKPDTSLMASIATIARCYPSLFTPPEAIEAMVSILKREQALVFKARANPQVYAFTAQLLVYALKDSNDWPKSVAKVYIEDCLADRLWTDLESSKLLVDNINTLFQPSAASQEQGGEGMAGGSTSGAPPTQTSKSVPEGETAATPAVPKSDPGHIPLDSIKVEQRWSQSSKASLKNYVVQTVSEQLSSRLQVDTVSRSLLRFLTVAIGYPELRLQAAQRIETWMPNPKLTRLCQDLLYAVASNCTTQTPEDTKVIEYIVGLKLKTKQLVNHHFVCVREMIGCHPGNLEVALRTVVHNELGQNRSPTNMHLLAMLMHSRPDAAPKLLGTVFQEFLANRDDYLRALRAFLRELIRQVKGDFNFVVFNQALMQAREDALFTRLEPQHKERMALALADLIAFSCMLTANLPIREAVSLYNKGDKSVSGQLLEFNQTLGQIEREAVLWVQTIIPNMYQLQPTEYKLCLRRVLFLEPAESYVMKDNWPPEGDRGQLLQLMRESCLQEDSLMRVLIIGLTKELPLSPFDAMDIADKLVARAANAHSSDLPRLPSIKRLELIDAIFDVCLYHAPDNIALPAGYTPPNLAISKLYWKGWLLLLVIASFNPSTVGARCWEKYPTLCGLMEMIMTGTYVYPPTMTLMNTEDDTMETAEDAMMRELQLARMEKEQILEYEGHLAAASSANAPTITESSSHLLNQVTLCDPKGPARPTPPPVIELVKSANRSLKLGQLLCQCRLPDFLLEVIDRQGTTEAMKWLSDLIENNTSSLEMLPVPCLCELFMIQCHSDGSRDPDENTEQQAAHRMHYKRKKTTNEKFQQRHQQLLDRLKELVLGVRAEVTSCTAVLGHLMQKLTNSHLQPRRMAIKALGELFDGDADCKPAQEAWLLQAIPQLPHFAAMKPHLLQHIREAIRVESDVTLLGCYIMFLEEHSSAAYLQDVVEELSVMMLTRSPSVITGLLSLPDVYCCIVKMFLVRSLCDINHDEVGEAKGDFVVIGSNGSVVMSESVILATYFLLSVATVTEETYNKLLDHWLPSDAPPPKIHHNDSEGRDLLLSDTIKMKMIKSSNIKLAEFALMTPTLQLLLTTIETFGVPLSSVEIALDKLDAITDVPELVQSQVKDPAYTIQLVEVQQLRGAKNGVIFREHLHEMCKMAIPAMPTISQLINEPKSPVSMEITTANQKKSFTHILNLSKEKLQDTLLLVFGVGNRDLANQTQARHIQLQLHQFLTRATITQDDKITAQIHNLVSCLHQLASTSAMFVEGLHKSCFAKKLFRQLSTILKNDNSSRYQKDCINKLCITMRLVWEYSKGRGSSLSNTLESCQRELGRDRSSVSSTSSSVSLVQLLSDVKTTPASVASVFPTLSALLCIHDNPLPPHGTLLLEVCHSLIKHREHYLENLLYCLVKASIEHGYRDDCLQFLVKLYSIQAEMSEVESRRRRCYLIRGLLMDLIEIVQPELSSACSSQLLSVLFRPPGGTLSSQRGGGGYLLSRLVHETSWCALYRTIKSLLLTETPLQVASSYVLEFLWACTQKPSLWQGKAKKEGVVNSHISMGIVDGSLLKVSGPEVTSILNLVVRELNESDESSLTPDSIIQTRVPLLASCIHHDNQSNAKSAILALYHNTQQYSHGDEVLGVRKLLVVLYRMFPHLLPELSTCTTIVNCTCELDMMIHNLICVMMDCQMGEDDAQKLSDASLICRRLVVHHPLIMLRHLGMTGWQLQGRTQCNSKDFYSKNHYLIFIHLFSLLELLQPYVFECGQISSLNACLQPYFDLIEDD